MRSERRLPAGVCAAVLCAALALGSPAGAASAPTPQKASPRPNPQKLWKRYPLNPKASGSSERSRTAGSAASSGDHTTLLTLLWLVLIVAAVAWARAMARLIRQPESTPVAGHSGPGGADLRDALLDAVRRVTRAAKKQVQERSSRY